jgi:zinc protease
LTLLKGSIQETTLENGLKVLTLEKHHLPVVCSMIWYKVGSVNERKGETGLSHFLEHLMFKGTDRYRKGEIDLKTMVNGGHNNAFTSHDYTAYFFNFASDRWEVALEIEANRMRNCLFDPEEFELERKVVLEEMKRSLDSPWGLLEVELEATMFRVHPYHHPIIGWQEDIEQIPRDAVIQYYHTYYLPNNATLVIVGDFDTGQTLEKIHRLFDPIPPGPPPLPVTSREPKQRGEHRFKIIQETQVGRLEMGYHTAKIGHPDNYPLDVLDTLLSSGKSSRLYQRLVEKEKMVTFVRASHDARKYEGAFFIYTELRPGKSLGKVEKILMEELDRIKQEGISDQELQRAKNIISADFIFDQETAYNLAKALGYYETILRYDYLNTYLENIEKVSQEDIVRVVNEYFRDENKTVGWSIPEKTKKNRRIKE